MAKSEIITTCDCGCGKTAQRHELDRWLKLTQYPEQSRTNKPKLGREGGLEDEQSCVLEFASFECLDRWTRGALKIIPDMMKSAANLWPRGGFYNGEFPTLWF